MTYHWNWGIFWQPSPEGDGSYLDMLVQGLVTTLETAALAWVLAFVLGSAMGVLRSLKGRPAAIVSGCWIELFRNVPLLVQLFLLYFVLPEVLPAAWARGSSNCRTRPSIRRWSASGSTCPPEWRCSSPRGSGRCRRASAPQAWQSG